ncbi:MAG: polysaccharide deacetylase family protein [Gilvibacter sp.]|uniref:polysaccharide deacetylase family protein n=1 Tax=Nonlabens ulvanivorans TaxID=906888 RepID=UPI003299A786
MLLIYVPKITQRVTFTFKHICGKILGLEFSCTDTIEAFVAHSGPKMAYGPQATGSAFYVKSQGLLFDQGVADVEIAVKPWGDTVGFFATSEASNLPFDVFAASFYLLSRYEEYLPHVKDEMGRYPASESLAYKEQFLSQPVVDIWAYKFYDALKANFDSLPQPREGFSIHNVIEVSEAYRYKNKGFLRSIAGFGSDIGRFRIKSIAQRTRVMLSLTRDPFDIFDWLIKTAQKGGAAFTVLFQIGDYSKYDYNISQHKKQHISLIKSVADYTKVGLRISHMATGDLTVLATEKKRIENIIHRPLAHTVNASGILRIPELPRALVDLEVAQNLSMGYPEKLGFRAGTCTPFYFYDLDFESQSPLLLVPFAASSEALSTYPEDERIAKVETLKETVSRVNGQLVTVFSNSDFSATLPNRIWRKLYSETLQYES